MQVLTVVAAYGWVMPRFLHRLVIDFERDMAAADAAAACQQRLATPATPEGREAAGTDRLVAC